MSGLIRDIIREELLGGSKGESVVSAPSIYSSFFGKYVICRSQNEGINAGYVEAIDDTGVVLKDARRLWYHKPAVASESWYEGCANHGVSGDSKLSATVSVKLIAEDYSLTVCTQAAEGSIRNAEVYQG